MPFMISCDFETEYGHISSFDNLVPYLQPYAHDDVNCVNPICHVAYYRTKKCDDKYSVTQDFLSFYRKLCIWSPKDTWLLYHNLKFDFGVIIWQLILAGWKQVFKQQDGIDLFGNYTSLEAWESTLDKYSFEIVGDDMSNINAVILYSKYQGKTKKVTLVDTFKIYNSSLKKYAETMKVELKGSYDFSTHVNGTNHDIITEYCKNDCRSLYKAHIKMLKMIGISALTSSSATFRLYKDSLAKQYLQENFGFENVGEIVAVRNTLKRNGETENSVFQKTFPPLGTDQRKISRYTYTGGYTALNQMYKGDIIYNVHSYDVNSMYPTVMCYDELPFGDPIEVDHVPKSGYSELVVYIDYETNAGYHPFFRVHRHAYIAADYNCPVNADKYRRTDYPVRWKGVIAINSIDLLILSGQSTIHELTVLQGYWYQTSNTMFAPYLLEKYKLKQDAKANHDNAASTALKVLLNGLYGKFGQDLTGNNKIYRVDDSKLASSAVMSIDNNGIYTPVASAVTAWARYRLITAIRTIPYNSFVYCDTDSIYCIDAHLADDLIGDNELGKWDYDGMYDKGKFLQPKRYILDKGGKLNIKCAGLSNSIAQDQITSVEGFNFGNRYEVLKMKMCLGGYNLERTEYTLEEALL